MTGTGKMLSGERWEHFDHGADIGVRGYGASKAAAFEQAALALTAVVTDVDAVGQSVSVDMECEGDDDELLFAEWLNAVIFEMAVRGLLFGRFEVTMEDGRLRARAFGEQVDAVRHRPAVEVKGATYTELAVARLEDGTWMAQTVVDV